MDRIIRPWPILAFVLLGAIWLASFRMADALTFFKTYSSIWFLPTGVTMAIVMVAPGWLKLAPLCANLLLAIPAVRVVVNVEVINDYEPILHGVRLFLVYGGAGYILTRFFRIELPATSLRDYQLITVTTLAAVTIATSTGIFMHVVAGNMTLAEAQQIAWSWWLGDAMGAFSVPPLLVPLLTRLLRIPGAPWQWPKLAFWGQQIALVSAIFLVAAVAFNLSAGAIRIWPLLIVAPMLFALRGGLAMAASCVFVTILLVPVLAVALSLAGQMAEMTPLLLITTIAGLLLGAAMSDQQKVLSQLEARVSARTAELQDAHEFQRHLIRSIGHDLRQPIDGMRLLLEGLQRSNLPRAESGAVRQANQLASLAAQFLSTILTYARFDAGKVTAQVNGFEVAELFADLRALFQPFAELKEVELVWDHDQERLVTDKSLLGQALSNLIDNAIRLSEPGMVVRVALERMEGNHAVVVSDMVVPLAHAPGAAGFGMDIVDKIAGVLGGKVISEANRRGVSLPNNG